MKKEKIMISVIVDKQAHSEFTAEAKRRKISLAGFARQSMTAEIDRNKL